MTIIFDDESSVAGERITTIGVGGAGGNAVNSMINFGVKEVTFMAVNTDRQALKRSNADTRLVIGQTLTRGLGAGSDPEIGRQAAEEDVQSLSDAIGDCDMVFVSAGMGGGTGSGAAPVVARLARERGALTVGVVTMPFDHEGGERRRIAEQGLAALSAEVDTLLVVPNQRVLAAAANDRMPVGEAYAMADRILAGAVGSIVEIIHESGYVNVDFADVSRVMSKRGRALMGSATAVGPDAHIEAADGAVSSPLLDGASIRGATGLLIMVTHGPDLPLAAYSEACQRISSEGHEQALVIAGQIIREEMGDEVRVTVIATGFEDAEGGVRDHDATSDAMRGANRFGRPRRTGETPAISENVRPVTAPHRAAPAARETSTSSRFTTGASAAVERQARDERNDYSPSTTLRMTSPTSLPFVSKPAAYDARSAPSEMPLPSYGEGRRRQPHPTPTHPPRRNVTPTMTGRYTAPSELEVDIDVDVEEPAFIRRSHKYNNVK